LKFNDPQIFAVDCSANLEKLFPPPPVNGAPTSSTGFPNEAHDLRIEPFAKATPRNRERLHQLLVDISWQTPPNSEWTTTMGPKQRDIVVGMAKTVMPGTVHEIYQYNNGSINTSHGSCRFHPCSEGLSAGDRGGEWPQACLLPVQRVRHKLDGRDGGSLGESTSIIETQLLIFSIAASPPFRNRLLVRLRTTL
jgi:hypothetical protein